MFVFAHKPFLAGLVYIAFIFNEKYSTAFITILQIFSVVNRISADIIERGKILIPKDFSTKHDIKNYKELCHKLIYNNDDFKQEYHDLEFCRRTRYEDIHISPIGKLFTFTNNDPSIILPTDTIQLSFYDTLLFIAMLLGSV